MNRSNFLARSATALGVFGAASAQSPRPLTPISVVVPTTAELLPCYYAVQQGWFAKAGLDLTMTTTTSGSAATAAVVGGSAQIGSSNVLSEVLATAKGIPIVIVAPAGQYDANASNNQIFVLPNAPIKTAKDLEGRTLAVASLHDLLSLAAKAWLEAGGADLTKVRFIEIAPSEMVVALQTGRVDAIYVYEPFRGAAERAGNRIIASPYSTISRDMLFSCWFASAAWVNDHKDAALAFSKVMHDAGLYTNAHYDDLLPLVSSYTKMTVDQLKSSHQVRVATSLRASQIQPIIDAAAKYHEIPASFPAEQMMLAGAP